MNANISKLINSFLSSANYEDIYNEFSLQHELGIFLRTNCPGYNVQFERNVSFFNNVDGFKNWVKHEIDIVVYSKDFKEKYAIELKFPKNGQHPEQMYKFIEDISFMEQVKEHLNFTDTYVLTLVEDNKFYQGKGGYIYSDFREGKEITGNYHHPTGDQKDTGLCIKNKYTVNWDSLDNIHHFYFIKIK